MVHLLASAVVDHVELATPNEAVAYIAVVLLWLIGVALFVFRKLRMSP